MSLSYATIETIGLWLGISSLLPPAVVAMMGNRASDRMIWWSLGSLSLGVLSLGIGITAGHWKLQELLQTVPATLARCSTEQRGEPRELLGISALSLTPSQAKAVLRCVRQGGDCWERLVAAVGTECHGRE
jgi:hypothetical protein